MDFWILLRKGLNNSFGIAWKLHNWYKKFLRKGKKIYSSFMAFVYPPLCLVCHKRLNVLSHLFCDACQQEWPWVERPSWEIEHPKLSRDVDSSATCEPIQAPLALVRAFQSGHTFLVETMAALMILQWERLQWPLPDRVVPLIGSNTRYLSKKARETRLLADQVAQLLLNQRASSLESLCSRETILFISIYEDRKTFEEKVWHLAGGFHRQVLSLSFF